MTTSRRSQRDQGPGVSLFPFLAVLLCTMGMLIMLLVLIGRDTADRENAEARADSQISEPEDPLFSRDAFAELADRAAQAESASSVPESKQVPESEQKPEPERLSPEDEQLYEEYLRLYGEMTPEQIEEERESAEWFLSELRGVRDRTRDELTAQRTKLSEAETEIAKQVEHLIELNRQAAALQEDGSDTDTEQLQAEIDAKAEEIAALNRQLEQLRQAAEESEKKPAYAIVPYRGKSGTFRRPIYVECTGSAVRLMPEGVEFYPDDFLVADYPGNPFDTGIRAARQYYIEKGEGSEENEPYPLLILKPESAQQYYIAKAALASWGGEFGYEFVESDAAIEYPKPDPELKRRVEEQVAISRVRLAGLIAAHLNALEARGENPQFIEDESLSGTGESGFAVSGSTESGSGSDFASQLGPYVKLGGAESDSSENGTAVPFTHGSEDTAAVPSYSPAVSNGEYAGELRGSGSADSDFGIFDEYAEADLLPASADDVMPKLSAAAETSEPGRPESGNSEFGNSEFGDSELGEPELGDIPSGNTGGSIYAQGAVPYSADGGNAAVTPFAEMTPKSAESESKEENGPAVDPRETVGNTTYMSGTEGSETAPPDNAVSSPVSGKPPKEPDPKEKKEPKVKAERNSREINLDEELRKPSQMAIERPVTVICDADGITFPTQPGIRNAKKITGGDQEILETVIACVRSWKAAGKNMYWSPWIKIKVNPGGESQSDQLTRLMKSQNVRVDQIRE